MATQYDPIAKDESLNTTETPSRNIADVLAQGLAAVVGAMPATELANLSDVTISVPSNGQTLKYNSVTQKWENANDAGGHTIEDPSGTDMTQRANLQFTGDGVSVTDDAVNGKTIVDISPDAGDISYDNTSSGLSATKVQGAIDEVVAKVDRGSVSVTADGTKTYAQMLSTLYGLADTSKISEKSILRVNNNICPCIEINGSDYYFGRSFAGSTAKAEMMMFRLGATCTRITWLFTTSGNTPYDESSETVPSGRIIKLIY